MGFRRKNLLISGRRRRRRNAVEEIRAEYFCSDVWISVSLGDGRGDEFQGNGREGIEKPVQKKSETMMIFRIIAEFFSSEMMLVHHETLVLLLLVPAQPLTHYTE